MAGRYLNYIAGQWVAAESGEFFENRNPADTRDLIGLFPKSSSVDVAPSARIAQEEIFGPVLSVLDASDLDEAVSILNGTRYGLSSSIYTRDINGAFRAIRDIEAGITYVNGPTIGAEVQLPFGGVKDMGNGHREASHTVLDTFSEWKSIYIDFSGKLQKAQIDTAE